MLSGTFGEADVNVLGYRSDVYSLGCILFKMCFGVTPYQHIEKMQVGRRNDYCFFSLRVKRKRGYFLRHILQKYTLCRFLITRNL